MANIPGISGFIQPGAFARDRVVSRGVSIPGGIRIVCVMGEGLREEVIVASAIGSGQDGNADCSPTGSGDGRFFSIQNAPVVSGRTEVRLNGSLLFGKEETIDGSGFSREFDFRLDPETGCIELQSAVIGDQDGKGFSAASSNIGTGILVEDSVCETLGVLDDSAPSERWTIKCVSVVRDSNGDPIPGLATFTASGSVSGQVYDASGSPLTFNSSYFTSSSGAVSANLSPCEDGFVVASGDSSGTVFPQGRVDMRDGDTTLDTTDKFVVPSADLVAQGQVVPGDYLCLDGYVGHEIESVEMSGDDTVITLVSDSLGPADPAWDEADFYDWEIRATNILIDDPSVDHDPISGEPDEQGSFTSGDVGKTVRICPGNNFGGGLFIVDSVTSTRRVRLVQLEDSTASFEDMEADSVTGYGDSGLTFHMLQNNGVILIGIQEGGTSFEVGDKFFVDVSSRALSSGDTLEARYIYEGDLNDPEFFTDANDLAIKHGFVSETNTLTLGSQMAFENGAPGVLAVQCKPPVPRRTSVTLLEERNSLGEGGFSACYDAGSSSAAACEVDDLRFVIPRPITGLRNGRPDVDSRVNIFVVRDGVETQVFPNKVSFYNSQLESDIQQSQWVSSSDNSFSYTIVNSTLDIVGSGDDGTLSSESGNNYFTTPEIDFDASHVGMTIVITSMENSSDGTVYTSQEEISEQLFGTTLLIPSVELSISSVEDDSLVLIESNVSGETLDLQGSYSDIQFFIKDPSNTNGDDASLLLHTDLVSSGVIKEGDGIRISYVDENDADFFDTNWFNALESLESLPANIIVPLPNQAISSVFRATVNHCENMSSVANRLERMAFIGAQRGVTPEALIGFEEIAVEDIGIIEGIQGDDPEEVLSGNTEDLVNFKLSDNYTSNRAVYFYPDSIVRNVNGTNISLHGFYVAAAAAGWHSARQNVALPLTNKTLSGFSITRDKLFKPLIQNQLGGVGATLLEPVTGGGRVLAGRTTSQSGYVEDEEISIMFVRDHVKKTLRDSLRGFIGGVQNPDTYVLMGNRVRSIMSALVSQGVITDFDDISVSQDKVDPRQINVILKFTPAYPINYIFIDIEVGII